MPFESTFFFFKSFVLEKKQFSVSAKASTNFYVTNKLSRDLYKTNAVEKHSFFYDFKT